ncbi:hypothetical protein [Cohnella zeiphila]|uniref:Uncharacterized protein n=1 Tax=Cohnella zeiphila TaxID=2761120 RepID=A0A7X0VXI8_9BACL|nr:hypothetical protein [Cohnella zeiphila]MBB6734061.1 hypothetical protein [Cohnella zeiphila]
MKREDLIRPGGGNKVRRFQAFFDRYGSVDRLVAMSDPGSHTFRILLQFLQENEGKGAKELHFLERAAVTTPYADQGRKLYLNHPRVTVRQAPALIQLAKYLAYRWLPFRGVRTIGIGGWVSLSPNPFETAFSECIQQLQEYNVEGPIVHLFPIASGNMLDGFLHRKARSAPMDHSFIGVTTGHRLSAPLLRMKYGRYREVAFIRPFRLSMEQYRNRAVRFHRHTGVWLDPIHTIHLYDVLESRRLPKDAAIVVWITCPYLDSIDFTCNSRD